jgi:CBS domain-containing protein
MMTDFQTLNQRDTLARVVGLVLAGSQHDFPVVDHDGRVVGILERDAFIAALSRQGQSVPVVNVMRRNIPEVDSHEMVEMALMRLQESGAKTLPVVHLGQFVGLITSENITEFLMIRSALKMAQGTPSPV